MQGSLSGNKGPRYRHSADDSAPYETITVDKLTPIIGAEIGGIDLSQAARQPPAGRAPSRAGRELRASSSATSTSRPTSIWPSAGCSATCTSIPPRRTSRASPS